MGGVRNNVVLERSRAFALRVVKLYGYLRKERKEYHLSTQVLRSGTSIGANIEEAMGACSRRDFTAKLSIAFKEAKETSYWLTLLRESELLEPRLADSLQHDCDELTKLLTAILKTLRSNS